MMMIVVVEVVGVVMMVMMVMMTTERVWREERRWMQARARQRMTKHAEVKEWRRRLGITNNKGTREDKCQQQMNRSTTLPTTNEHMNSIANNKGTGAQRCQQQRNTSTTLPSTNEHMNSIANNKGTGT